MRSSTLKNSFLFLISVWKKVKKKKNQLLFSFSYLKEKINYQKLHNAK